MASFEPQSKTDVLSENIIHLYKNIKLKHTLKYLLPTIQGADQVRCWNFNSEFVAKVKNNNLNYIVIIISIDP